MAAPKRDLPDIMRGDSRNYRMVFKDPDGNPIDISNTTLWSTVKESRDDPDADAILQKSVVFPADANSLAGVGFLKWDPADTEVFEPGARYWYDFQWVRSASTDVNTMGYGQIKVLQDITEATA